MLKDRGTIGGDSEMPGFTGKKIAFLGGGLREVELVKALQEAGAEVSISGLKSAGGLRVLVQSPEMALDQADALILPVSGLTADGKVKESSEDGEYCITRDLLNCLKPKAAVVVGKANPYLLKLCQEAGSPLLELVDDDEFAIFNSIPTAEGALVTAIESSEVTLHSSEVYVLGYGRCGRAIARMLWGLGARVHVLDRSPVKRAQALEAGLDALDFVDIKAALANADFIFNTVPALVLTTEVLEALKSEVTIVDIASAPGGVDFAAAKALGIQAILALGLPGKYAPKTAGLILAKIVPRKLAELLS